MGLDMYLSASRYIGGWQHTGSERMIHDKILELMGGFRCEGSPFITVSINVGYWRKANAIHRWFVENVQDGKDDCGTYHVSREKLIELKSLCESVFSNPEKDASEVLPTKSGFFFGETDYDEYYFQDLRYTIDIITKVLEVYKDDSWEFQYHSSW